MRNSINEGKELVVAKEADGDGVVRPRPSTALEDLKAEIVAAAAAPTERGAAASKDEAIGRSLAAPLGVQSTKDGEYGFDLTADPRRFPGPVIAGPTEASVFAALGRNAREVVEDPNHHMRKHLADDVVKVLGAAVTAASLSPKERSTVQSRSELREAAVNEMRLAGVEKGAIELDKPTAKAWADADALEFGRARSDARREAIMESIAGNIRHSPEYASEMASRSKTIATAATRINDAVDQEEAKRSRDTATVRASEADAAARSVRVSAIDAAAAAAVALKRQQESASAAQELNLGTRPSQAPAIDMAKEIDRAANKGADPKEILRLQARSETHFVYSTAYVEIERRAAAMKEMRNSAEAKREDGQDGARWAREDLKALPHVRDVERTVALDAIARSMEANRGYANEVKKEAPELVKEVAQNKVSRDTGTAQTVGDAAEAVRDAETRRSVIKRPIQEEELSLTLRTRFLVSSERDGLLDKGRTDFTFRGGARDGVVAFQDVGKQLTTVGEDRETIRSMVEVATTKGWKEVTVNGTDEFKRAAWLEAKLAGMEVNGYEPREADKKRLAELQVDRAPVNSIATADREQTRKPGDDGEKLREWIVQEMQTKPVLSAEERSKMNDAVSKGDVGAQAEIRADAKDRSERDLEAVRRMGKPELDQVAEMYRGAPSVETERRVRTLLDGAGRHEPAHDVKPENQRAKGVHVDGDALTLKEQTTLGGIKEFLEKQSYPKEFIAASMNEVESRMRSQRVHVGVVVNHGEDHYKGDKKNDMSYYVTLKTATGLETVWGKQIGEALQKGDVKQGDHIVLANVGKQPVSVLEQGKGENGQVVKQWKGAQKNEWTAQPIDRLNFKDREGIQAKAAARAEPTLQVYDSKAARSRSDRADRDQGHGQQPTHKRDLER